MAFVKVEGHRKSGRSSAATVSMGLYLADGKAFKKRSVIFFIARDVVAKLGWELLDNRIRLGLYEGIHKDQGFLMLVPSDRGYLASAGSKRTEQTPIRFAAAATQLRHYTLNDSQADTAPVQYVIDGNTLIIECPEWLKINPLSGMPEKPVEVVPEPKLLPPFPETRVSHSVQQPPPGMPKRRGRPPKGGHRYS